MARKDKFFMALILLAMVALVSCTPSPEWVKSQRDKVSLNVIPMSTANAITPGNANGFTILISVTTDPLSSVADIPISQGGRNLGAKLHIYRPDDSHKQASLNADYCVDKAAEKGVIQTFSSGPSGQDVFQSTSESYSIKPFLDRFTECLKVIGYSVQQ